ncbi:tail fiber assembly protein [Salmonella enterica subsp. diarizonae]|uniref:Tail fiber assembly protein n=2 Tax=Salmonella enterica subsp. salamae TaxID=59202 RepID=A0A5Y1WAQ1_SALER|nr:hypothetical protein [Salmonella enterica]EAS0616216.1 tail fiber assembly protein [Salmonella enterica subsp. enterica serovar Dahomey]EBH8665252.1 hypothetical protein [Salmonella enterica subsp. enterica serovar Luke]EBP3977891.1 tail fiber assembly protein [Salmonella enterica subsp. enterica]EBR9812350.1 hypothetical protein [Salmonella enterica subsp. enterica serovar Teshie]EBX5689444.1 hypothetical protein [Salmonella enterica subsp. enterica serovar Kaolack]EBZ2914172.1 hypothetic
MLHRITLRKLWLNYLDALESVDTSSAPDIEWPIPPGDRPVNILWVGCHIN